MRFDRIITLGVAAPGRRLASLLSGNGKASGGQERSLPILMYHSVSDDPEIGIAPYFRTATTAKRFGEQMQWLKSMGYQGVTLSEGVDYLSGKGAPTSRPVAITFDDGFRDFNTAAYPILRDLGFSATMYLPTAFIGHDRRQFCGRDCMTWPEIKSLQSAGIEFGSHTVNHPTLYGLPWAEIEDELAASKRCIEGELGGEISSFAYPYAYPQADSTFTKAFSTLLERLNYKNCVTTIVGRPTPASSVYSLNRLPANDCDDEPLFTAKMNGNYDWIGTPQRWMKAARKGLSGKHAYPGIPG